MLAGLLVVLLVEAPHQLLEDGAHPMVVETWLLDRAVAVQHRVGAEVDLRGEEFLDEGAKGIGLGEAWDLVAELELVEDVLHVWREAVEVRLEVGLELLLAGAGTEVAEGELRGVVEGLPRSLTQGLVLMDDPSRVERRLHGNDVLLRGLK